MSLVELFLFVLNQSEGYRSVVIDGREFDWDENKYEANIKKHSVDFYEAASVIFAPGSIILYARCLSTFL